MARPTAVRPTPVQPGAPKPRRRGAALETALLAAAWEELSSVGYASLTMEGVAERAGTSRAVLYRRWRNRPELVIAAMRRHRPILSGEVPDTGALREDVLAVLRREAAGLAEVGPETTFGLLGDCFADPELLDRLQRQVGQVGSGVMATILRRAAERGEVHGEFPPRVVTLPTDLFRHELFLTRNPPTERVMVEIVDQVFLPLVGGPSTLR